MGAPVAAIRARVAAMSPATRRFWVWILVICALGLVIRSLWIFVGHADWNFWGDSWLYKNEGRLLADGQWFKDPADYYLPFGNPRHQIWEAADHPPVFILFVAGMEWLGITGLHWQMFICSFVGIGTVVLVGLLGRKLVNNRVGILAALAAAIYPNFWINDGMLMSETFFVFFISLALLLAYRYWQAPSLKRGLGLSVAMTMAVMTRSEGLLLLPLLVAPVIVFTKGWDWGKRFRALGAAALVSFVMIAPWVGYNFARFEEPVFLAAGDGYVLGVGNCDLTYNGAFLGYWTPNCILAPGRPQPAKNADMSQMSLFYRDNALDYMWNHKKQVPKVVLARVGRLWGLYRVDQNADLDINVEGRGEVPVWLGVGAYYALMPFAIAGAFILRRRRVKIWPFIVVVVIVATVTAAVSFGITRYRAAAEVAIVVFAAVALDALLTRLRPPKETGTAKPADPAAADDPSLVLASTEPI